MCLLLNLAESGRLGRIVKLMFLNLQIGPNPCKATTAFLTSIPTQCTEYVFGGISVCLQVCMYVCMHVRAYVRTQVCNVCMYVCMYVCTYAGL